MFKKTLSLFILLILISCGGGGGGGDDSGGTGPSNDPPVAIFTANPLSGGAPLAVTFTSTSTNATAHEWDFNGDGILDASGVIVQYTYNEAGSYSVSLTATGPNGADVETKTNYINVSPTPPTAVFSANTTTGKKDLRVEYLPIIAEDLGVITPDVEKLRKNFELPGMKILQFAFDGNEDNPYLPKNIEGENWVVYTGTHDNSTCISWWECLENNTKKRIKDE